MTNMIQGSDLNTLKNFWEKFNAKHPEFEGDSHIIFHPEIKPKKNWVMIDLGCGPGRMVRKCHNRVKKYYGVDIAKTMVAEAQRRYNFKNCEFLQNDGHTLKEFNDNFFDLVIIHTVLQHMGKWMVESYIKEIYRTLKPNGILVANFPKLSFYGASGGYILEEMDALLKEFKWKQLSYEGLSQKSTPAAYFYVFAQKKVIKNK